MLWRGTIDVPTVPQERFDPTSLVANLQEDLFGGMEAASGALLLGIVAWLIILPLAMGVIYAITKPVVARLLPSNISTSSSATPTTASSSSTDDEHIDTSMHCKIFYLPPKTESDNSSSSTDDEHIDTSMHCKIFYLPPKTVPALREARKPGFSRGSSSKEGELQLNGNKAKPDRGVGKQEGGRQQPRRERGGNREAVKVVAGWNETEYDGWRLSTFNSDGPSAAETVLMKGLRQGALLSLYIKATH
jgi:hypothetical protein